jgi:TIR domain
METADLEKAVRRVLPALNFDPHGFQLDRGFLARARHTGQPRAVVINKVTDQFVFVGFRTIANPEAVVENMAAEALAFLGRDARIICERLIVGWADPRSQVFAAAFVVSAEGGNGRLVGSSWTEPETWPEPMIDYSKSGDDMIDDALDRLELIIRNRSSYRGSNFNSEFNRAMRLVDLALLRFGGEGQSTEEDPAVYAPDESWSSWLYYFNQSVYDEWKRIGGSVRRVLPSPMLPSRDGPLKGLRVFLSYARPDAMTLAWPIHEALSFCGATVWFDRTQTTSERQLALGLAEIISSHDVYVMCASDEFFERAGYATQEFAWAVQHRESVGKPQHFLVVARPNTILPGSVATWPKIELRDDNREQLAHSLVTHLGHTVPLAAAESPFGSLAVPFLVTTPPSLPQQADIPALWRRIQHAQLFDEIGQETLTRLMGGQKDDRQATEVRKRLLHLGDGLEWTGTLEDIDRWPDDPFIRDARLRFAGARAVIGARWPLNDDLDWRPGVVDDIEYLATQRVPVIDWPAVPGWDDGERRFALRYHAGLLRILHEIFKRGLWGGLIHVPSSTRDAWEEALYTRRRECYDALLELRLNGRLSWQRDLPTWDRLFRACSKLLTTTGSMPEPLPFAVLQMLLGNAPSIAAVAAETGWYTSRYGGFASQSFMPRFASDPVNIEVYALSLEGIDSGATADIKNSLRIGRIADVEIRLSWRRVHFSAGSPDEETTG